MGRKKKIQSDVEVNNDENIGEGEKDKSSEEGFFAVKYLIKTTQADEVFLEREFEHARRMQIATIKEAQKRINKYYNDKRVKEVRTKYKKIWKEEGKAKKTPMSKEDSDILKLCKKEHLLDKTGLNRCVEKYRHLHEDMLMSVTARGIAENVYVAVDAVLHRKGDALHIPREINTLSDSNGDTKCIQYTADGWVKYAKKIKARIHIEPGDCFKQEALNCQQKKSQIKRVQDAHGKYRYYLIITFKGKLPPKSKISPVSGNVVIRERKMTEGRVGIDIGVSTVAVVNSKGEMILEEYCGKVKRIDTDLAKLQRKRDRQLRANNPDNFNPNGTCKKNGRIEIDGKKVRQRLQWNHSASSRLTRGKIAVLQAKRAATLRQYQEDLANRVLQMGNDFKIESMDIKSMQSKKNKIRLGKTIQRNAPAQFVTILKRKAASAGRTVNVVNTYSVKASQYNHLTGMNIRKGLKERWVILDEKGEIKMQRDLYSAFLLMNCVSINKTNQELCVETFADFKTAHDKKMDDLKRMKEEGSKFPSSMGI